MVWRMRGWRVALVSFVAAVTIVSAVPERPACANGRYIVGMKHGHDASDIFRHQAMRTVSLKRTDFRVGRRGRGGFVTALTTLEAFQMEGLTGVDFVICDEQMYAFEDIKEEDEAPQPPSTGEGKTEDEGPSPGKNGVGCVKQKSSPYHLERLMRKEPAYDGTFIHGDRPGEGIDIYVFDTGLEGSHPDFGGRANLTVNFTDDDDRDFDGHGTHVAGIAASRTYGVAKSAHLIGVKVLSDEGSGSFSNIIRGLEWALENSQATGRRAVCNLSLGGPRSAALNRIIDEFVDEGLVIVSAAGNNSGNACKLSPSSARKVITVGATDRSDTLTGFSNSGHCVDIFAPGDRVLSVSKDGGESVFSGTSQATPIVAGLAAVLLAKFPGRSALDVTQLIKQSAVEGVITDMRDTLTPNLLAHVQCGDVPPVSKSANADDADGNGHKKDLPVVTIAVISGVGILMLVTAGVVTFVFTRR